MLGPVISFGLRGEPVKTAKSRASVDGSQERYTISLAPSSASFSAVSAPNRSEEHTSELQSHLNLVCRLLLEKKKNTNNIHSHREQLRLLIMRDIAARAV